MTDKEIYETATLSISILSGNDLSAEGLRVQRILEDYLPYYWDEDERVQATIAILTGKGPEKWTSYSTQSLEVQEIIKKIETAQSDDAWDAAMSDFGLLCLEELEVIWAEGLSE